MGGWDQGQKSGTCKKICKIEHEEREFTPTRRALIGGKTGKVFFAIPTRNYKGGGGGGEEIVKNITFCQQSIPAEFHN